ncbi:ECF-type sigma factor [Tahibacter amnicola]|uniref:ECF-type sigma factor n=1 Tax=Tahibacter amnicola TaxID=2976241 RepID=A0ABY6BI26_9GAMM|nr:ECF-type sigma factor [Tahibacter amnicola]UXI69241.1 ECF-type sigma factor [Tahibacter amnicola]
MSGAELTELLNRAQHGDGRARDEAFDRIYSELKRIAAAELRRNPGATLNTTGLVHEAYAKLAANYGGQLTDRSHFFSLAARAMRQILVDQARRRIADKRGGGVAPTDLDGVNVAVDAKASEMLVIDQALDRLARRDARAAQVVEWHFFGGFTFDEIAAEMSLSERTVRSDWALARAILSRELEGFSV